MSIRMLIINIMLTYLLVYNLLSLTPQAVQSVQLVMSEDKWLEIASIAWRYYTPGLAVEISTGLHHSGLYWPYFTDWDLGSYIFAILDAEELGILPAQGLWGADYRLQKIINFLKTRELNQNGVPFLWYDSRDGRRSSDQPTNPSDTGRLLVALYKLWKIKPQFREDIDYIVKQRTNFTYIASSRTMWASTSGAYAYYAALGFKYFGFGDFPPVKEKIESFIRAIEQGPRIMVEGVDLPKIYLTSEPLIHLILETEYDSRIFDLFFKVYMAHFNRYKRGELVAFSEGNTPWPDPSYVYEWVTTSDGSSWVITRHDGSKVSIPPISYLKVALAFHAIYPSTYSRDLVNFILSGFAQHGGDPNCPNNACGWMDGVDLSGNVVSTIIDRTNSIILSAARFSVKKGLLKIETNPPVPATLYVDGVARDPWGVDYLPTPKGIYKIRFGDVGLPLADFYTTPSDQRVYVQTNEVTIVKGNYTLAGLLVVRTNPPVPAVIYINSTPVAVWGLDYLPVKPGTYVIRFGDVPYYVTPEDVIVQVQQKQVTIVTGNYTRAGLLVVKTIPPVPSVIFVNGTPVAVWGLDYLPIKPGVYEVRFGDVDGYDTPPPQVVTIHEDQIITVTGNFTENPNKKYPTDTNLGYLKVETNPPVPATLYVDGIPRDPWGIDFLPLPEGKHVVRFGDVGLPLADYYIPPPDIEVNIKPGEIIAIVGNYTLAGLLEIKTVPPVPATLYINGTAVDPWGLDFLPLKPGHYSIRFGDVPYYIGPTEDVLVEVSPKQVTTVIGYYQKAGLLVVRTNPPVPSVIFVNGTPVAVWGLDYLPVKPGTYYIYFSPIAGRVQPEPLLVTVRQDEIVTVEGDFP